MSSNHEGEQEKWVDDLLAKLPAPTPVPQDISDQLDAFLADHISTLEAEARSAGNNVRSLSSQRSNRFTSRYQFLAAAAAVVGVLTFVGTQTSLFTGTPESSEVAAQSEGEEPNSNEPTTTPSENVNEGSGAVDEGGAESAPPETPSEDSDNGASQEDNQMIDPEVSSSDIQVLGSEGGTQYLPSDAPSVQITKSGMDYAKNIDAILDEIAPYGEPGKLNKLNNSELACVIKFKIVDRVVAVDSGKYNGASVVTFFAIADDGTTKAYISKPGNGCELVKKVSIN